MKKTVPVTKNQTVILKIEDISSEGEGIGRYEGYTLFVPRALTGESIRAKVVKAGNSFGYARMEEILETASYRQEADCPAGELCGGCTLQHMTYEAGLRWKEKQIRDCLERIAGLQDIPMLPIVGMEEPYYYRNKVQYPIRQGKSGEVQIGFFAPHSHRIIESDICCQQDAYIGVILEQIRKMMQDDGFSAYEEESGKGLLRHTVIRKSFLHQHFHIVLVLNAKEIPAKLRHAVLKRFSGMDKIQGVTANFHTEKNNVILGRKTEIILGDPYVEDAIGKYRFLISPNSFFQVNAYMTERLYEAAVRFADCQPGERVFDLYCGIGTISLFLAESAQEVIGIEIVPEAVADAKQNAKRNGMDNLSFYAGKAEEVFPKLYREGKRADVVVVDPPRKGLEREVITTIQQMSPSRIVYVSCNPATLARDIKQFVEAGEPRYRLEKVQGFDLFARGGHVETVVLMSRVK